MEINKYTENKKEKTSSSQLEMRNHQVRKIDIDNTTTLSPIVANNTLKHELLSKLTIPIVESHVNVQFLDRKALVPTKGEVKNMQLDIKFQFSGIKFNLKHNLNKQSVQIMINEAREEALLRQKMFISELMDFCEQNSVAKIFVLLNRALPEFNKSKENLEFGGFHSINSKNMKIASQESLKDYSIMKFVFETESDEQSESHNSVNEELSSTSEEDSQQEEEFKVAQN